MNQSSPQSIAETDPLTTRLRMLSLADLEDGRHQCHANYRVAQFSNDIDGTEYYLALFDEYTAELEQRQGGSA